METSVTPGQRFRWVAEDDPHWDEDRDRVFATVPAGVLPEGEHRPGERLPGDWWRVLDAGRVVGYGWLDDVWGDAEILLVVEASARGTGAGAFALARLEHEASVRGLNYVVNQVRPAHPERDRVTGWFLAHGFRADDDGRLRKRVGERAAPDPGQAQDGRPGARPAQPPDDVRRARYEAERRRAATRTGDEDAGPVGAPMGPGHEESGGYVDPEEHRF